MCGHKVIAALISYMEDKFDPLDLIIRSNEGMKTVFQCDRPHLQGGAARERTRAYIYIYIYNARVSHPSSIYRMRITRMTSVLLGARRPPPWPSPSVRPPTPRLIPRAAHADDHRFPLHATLSIRPVVSEVDVVASAWCRCVLNVSVIEVMIDLPLSIRFYRPSTFGRRSRVLTFASTYNFSTTPFLCNIERLDAVREEASALRTTLVPPSVEGVSMIATLPHPSVSGTSSSSSSSPTSFGANEDLIDIVDERCACQPEPSTTEMTTRGIGGGGGGDSRTEYVVGTVDLVRLTRFPVGYRHPTKTERNHSSPPALPPNPAVDQQIPGSHPPAVRAIYLANVGSRVARSGVGRALVAKADTIAIEWGVTDGMFTHVEETNKDGVAFYRACGFEEVGRWGEEGAGLCLLRREVGGGGPARDA